MAQHQGPRAERQVRHPRAAGIPRARPTASGKVVMTTNRSRASSCGCGDGAALLAVGGPTLWAQQTAADQPPAFRTGVELVTVDVGVVDRQGQPLRGLAAGDFTVTVAGQPRRVVSAEFVEPAAARAHASAGADGAHQHQRGGRHSAGCSCSSSIRTRSSPATCGAWRGRRRRFFDEAVVRRPLGADADAAGPNVAFTWAHDRVRDALARWRPEPPTTRLGIRQPVGSARHRQPQSDRAAQRRRARVRRAIGDRVRRLVRRVRRCPRDRAGRPGDRRDPGGGAAGGGTRRRRGGWIVTGRRRRQVAAVAAAADEARSRSGGGGGLGGRQLHPRYPDAGGIGLARRADDVAGEHNSLRQLLAVLGRVRGDKTIILISGGWPLDEREQHTLMSTVAAKRPRRARRSSRSSCRGRRSRPAGA